MHLLAWIPESLLNEKGTEEWGKFVRIEERSGVGDEDDGELKFFPVKFQS